MRESQEEQMAEIEEKSEGWDLASRFQLSGDFRVRGDYMTADAPSHYQALQITRGLVAGGTPGPPPVTTYEGLQAAVAGMKQLTAERHKAMFAGLYNTNPVAATEIDNDTIWTNRLRLNMRVKATENLEFKGRLAMYKAWGMQNNPVDSSFLMPAKAAGPLC